MKIRHLTISLVICLLGVAANLYAQESEMKLYRIYVQERAQVRKISEMGYDIYDMKAGEYVDVLAYPDRMPILEEQVIP